MPNSAFHNEYLPQLPPDFLNPHSLPNTPTIKDKRILSFCPKNNIIDSLLSGYLHYKTITSQNVLSEAQVKIFFIS